MAQSYLISGVDLLSLECLTAADVQQAITAAIIRSPYGLIVVQDAAPDVVATEELARFVWLKSIAGVPTGEFYYYNGSSWTLLSLVDGALLADNSVALSKIKLTGAAPFYIIQVNAAGTALQFISVVNAIQNSSLPVNKIVPGGAAHAFVSLANVNQFVPLSGLTAYFVDGSIPITRLAGGGASVHGLWLRTFETGSPVEWADFDPNEQIDDEELEIQKLAGNSIPLGALQAPRRNAANNGWEAFTPITSAALPEVYDTNSVIAATQDIQLTKPTGKTWRTFEIAYVGNFDSNGAAGTVNVAFTWQTAPLAGSALTPSSAAGCGNSGQICNVDNSDDNIGPTWMFKGTVPASLAAIDTITLRATINKGALVQHSGVFMGKGIHDA